MLAEPLDIPTASKAMALELFRAQIGWGHRVNSRQARSRSIPQALPNTLAVWTRPPRCREHVTRMTGFITSRTNINAALGDLARVERVDGAELSDESVTSSQPGRQRAKNRNRNDSRLPPPRSRHHTENRKSSAAGLEGSTSRSHQESAPELRIDVYEQNSPSDTFGLALCSERRVVVSPTAPPNLRHDQQSLRVLGRHRLQRKGPRSSSPLMGFADALD